MAILKDLGGPRDRSYYLALDIAATVKLHTDDLDGARELFEEVVTAESEIIENFPDFEFTLYNFACNLARQGETKEALRRLQQALDLGFAHNDFFKETGLDPLRGLPEFEVIADKVRRRLDQQPENAEASDDWATEAVSPNW